jgi:hypothetical protein
MTRIWFPIYALSLLMGVALWLAAPSRWQLDPAQALLFGSGLYFGALHRYVRRGLADEDERRAGWGRLVPGMAIRAALFVGLAALQAYLCFEVLSQADVRSGFILSATWLAAWAVLDAGPKRITE